MSKKLKPITPTTTQLRRIRKLPPGVGFFMYNDGYGGVKVVEISVDIDLNNIINLFENTPLDHEDELEIKIMQSVNMELTP